MFRLVSLLIFSLFFFTCSSENPIDSSNNETESEKPNVLIILADDLTSGDLNIFGGENISTPNIDQLAEEGMLFTKAFTSSAMCTPVRSSLYTGLYPVKHGAHKNGPQGITKSETISMPVYLADIGYRVGLTGKYHVFPSSVYPFKEIPGFTNKITGLRADYDVEKIKPFMTRSKEQPFCLVIGSTLPHAPWTVGDRSQFDTDNLILPPNFVDTEETRRRYRNYLAEVSALDKQVGDIMKVLDKEGLSENTLVFFLAEQGSQFAGNKWTLWDEGLSSAVIARLPGRQKL